MSREQKAGEKLARKVHQIRERKAQLASKRRDADRDAEMQRLQAELTTARRELASAQAGNRLSQYPVDDFDDHGRMVGASSKLKGLRPRQVHALRSNDPEVVQIQEKLDVLYMMKHALVDEDGTAIPLSESKYLRELVYTDPYFNEHYRDGIGAGSGQSMNIWVPDGFSASLHAQVKQDRRVAALHRRITMTEPTFYMPIEGLDGRAYVVPENTTANAHLTPGNLVPAIFDATSPTGATDPGIARLTLTAKKIGNRVVVSEETKEDSIIAASEYFRSKLVDALVDAEEDATINGDLLAGTAGALDGDRTASGWLVDQIVSWNGYRKRVRAQTAPALYACATAQVITETDFMQLKIGMGKYAMGRQRATLVVGPLTYNRMLTMKDSQGNQLVTTIDKYGGQATVVTGEMGSVFGIPLLVSDFVREDLDIGGTYNGTTATDRSLALLVNREQFIYGDYRLPRIKGREVIETDQSVLVIMRRGDFSGFFPTQRTVAELHNI